MRKVEKILCYSSSSVRRSLAIDTMHDIYAYGVEPLTNDELQITAERNRRPVIIRLDANGELRSVRELASTYRGISSSSTSGNLTRVITYNTVPGTPQVRLETFKAYTEGLRRVRVDSVALDHHVLRIYDVGSAPWEDGEAVLVVALVGDEIGRCRETFFLFHLNDTLEPLGTVNLLGEYNELRSVSLHSANDALYAITCRRFWLKNQAFVFRILPDPALVEQKEFICNEADFQQVGTNISEDGSLSIVALHRHRRDIDGIRYNVEWF